MHVPNVSLARLGQIKIAVLLALSRKLICLDDIIVCLTGRAGSGSLDTVSVMQVGTEFEMFLAPTADEAISKEVQPEVLECVVSVSESTGTVRVFRAGRIVAELEKLHYPSQPEQRRETGSAASTNPVSGIDRGRPCL